MNHGMQTRVVGDTIQDIEARQLLASRQAQEHANFPRFMELNGMHLPLYKYKELEDLGKQTLKKRCLDFRDQVEATGCRFFENHQHLKLNAAQGEDKLLEWFINVQVTLAAALGMDGLDHEGFGASHLAGTLPPPARHNKQERQPQPLQPEMTQEEYEQLMLERQYQQQQRQQLQRYQQQQRYQEEYQDQYENYRNGPPPSRGQAQMKQAGMHDVSSDPRYASRFDDAAQIRARNSTGSNIFG